MLRNVPLAPAINMPLYNLLVSKQCSKQWHKTFTFKKIIFYSDGPIKLWQIFTNNYFLASHYRYVINSTTVTQVDGWTGTQMKRCIKQTAISYFTVNSNKNIINNRNMKISIISNSLFISSFLNKIGHTSGTKQNNEGEKSSDMISLANSHCSKIHSNSKTTHNTQREKTPSFVRNY